MIEGDPVIAVMFPAIPCASCSRRANVELSFPRETFTMAEALEEDHEVADHFRETTGGGEPEYA